MRLKREAARPHSGACAASLFSARFETVSARRFGAHVAGFALDRFFRKVLARREHPGVHAPAFAWVG